MKVTAWYKYLLPFFVVLIVVALQPACKKDDNQPPVVINEEENEVSFIVNGGSAYNGKYVTFSDFNELVTKAAFVDSIGLTHIEALGQWDNANVYMEIYFPGDTTGYYFLQEPQPPLFEIPDDRYFTITLDNAVLFVKYLNLAITKYDEVGKRIEGTFNGQLYDYYHNPNGEVINVNNGVFNLKRTQ